MTRDKIIETFLKRIKKIKLAKYQCCGNKEQFTLHLCINYQKQKKEHKVLKKSLDQFGIYYPSQTDKSWLVELLINKQAVEQF